LRASSSIVLELVLVLVLMVAPKLFISWGQNSLGPSFGA
jgi:hypothetical protein